MPLVLNRASLVAQVADAIRAEILAGAWEEWLPGERDLSQTLHVSRNTCRAALRMLYGETLIAAVRGRGIRINRPEVSAARSASRRLQSVSIVAPEALSRMRPKNALCIDELRNILFDSGVRMQLHHSPAYYRAYPHRALERLTRQNRHDCWILFLSNEPLQRWFMKEGLPCVICGSAYPGVRLPSADQDYRAICRHAAGKLIALGHRRLVFFNRRSRAAGDLESEAGFLEGIRSAGRPEVEARILYHNDSCDTVARLVRQLFAASPPPTGILVANSYCYLSVASTLARLGRKIPEDVSLISRDDDPFLSYLEPEPARYLNDPLGLARKIMVLLRPLLAGTPPRLEPVRLLPRFIAGGSCRSA